MLKILQTMILIDIDDENMGIENMIARVLFGHQ